MSEPETPSAPSRAFAHLEDRHDLHAVVSTALAARPLDESMLRRAVWTFVGAERDAGASPGRVVLALTELSERSGPTSEVDQPAVIRRVILWCVEGYFGQLGGGIEGGAD